MAFSQLVNMFGYRLKEFSFDLDLCGHLTVNKANVPIFELIGGVQ